ncbi:MAG: flagellar FlbD family protein [Acidobacteriaceae bacterium]|nr:flagellar FlbD family protein [Acidobacteriaceae bacterium]
MIHLTRINRVPLVLNSDLIEHVEATPDTVISLTTGQKILVLESPGEIVERVVQFRRSIAGGFNTAGRGVVTELRRVGAEDAHAGAGHRE